MLATSKLIIHFSLALTSIVVILSSAAQGTAVDGIDEHEAVIEFDSTDDLFLQLTSRDSTTVHLYSRQDPQYLAKRKAFRRAA